MKKLFASLFIITLCISLCGCMGRENDRRFIVSAIGFSEGEKGITLLAETIVVNSEISEEEPKPQVFIGEGETIEKALDNIALNLTRPLLLEHCGVIVLENGISEKWFDKICDYCFTERKITLSAYIVSSDNPLELLSGEPLSSVAVGYDIMALIEQSKKRSEKGFKNRFFELEAKRLSGETEFSIPSFKREEELIALTDSKTFMSGGIKND